MSEDFEGKVAFITGAARGQGRAHAVRLAGHGVNIIAVDICADLPGIDYPQATPADLEETRGLVESAGAKIVTGVADVADQRALKAVVDEGLSHFGRLDIAIANAGVVRFGEDDDPITTWSDIINTNLTGAWNTCRVAIPPMVDGGRAAPSSSPVRRQGSREPGRTRPAVRPIQPQNAAWWA